MTAEPAGWTSTHETTYAYALAQRGSDKGRLQRWCLLLHGEHAAAGMLPTSARFLYYELVQRGVIPKQRVNRDGSRSKRRMDQDVSDALTDLRDAGLVAWPDIVDETRTVEQPEYAPDIQTHLGLAVEYYRRDLWDGEQPPLIITESRSLKGVLRGLAYENLCPITSTNGQASGALLANDVLPVLTDPRPVLYLGDLDLSGGHIEASTRARLAALGAHVDDWTRVAITAEQVAERGLEPVMKTDRRYRGGRAYEAWETEALGQAAVVEALRDALDGLRADRGLPDLADVRVRERQEQDEWRRRLARGAD